MGQKLGCGAHLAQIERTAVGEFSLDQGVKLEELGEAARADKFSGYVLRLEDLVPNFPPVNGLAIVEPPAPHGTEFYVTLSPGQPGPVEPRPGGTDRLAGG